MLSFQSPSKQDISFFIRCTNEMCIRDRYLNEHGVPSPSAYKVQKGLPVSTRGYDDPMWGVLSLIHISVGMGGISADDDLAVEKLTKKLEGLESLQATMKAVSYTHLDVYKRQLMDDPAQPAPASGKEEFYLSKKDDVLLTPEQIAAEERRWLFDAPIAELAEVKGVSIDEEMCIRDRSRP